MRVAATLVAPLLPLAGLLLACGGEPVAYVGSHPPAQPSSSGGQGGAGGAAGAPACPLVAGTRARIELESGGQVRRFLLSVPANHAPAREHAVVMGLHARGGDGAAARDLLELETVSADDWAVFVYPEGLMREWKPGEVDTGWQNGPAADAYGGTEDLAFIRDVIAYLEGPLCVRIAHLSATGWGWGGDFSAVLGCYAGDRFDAVVPVHANTPYFLPLDAEAEPPCVGQVAAWTLHGQGTPDYPLEFGLAQRDFWVERNGCNLEATTPIVAAGMVADDACVEYTCTGPRTRFCAYTASVGASPPSAYYAPAAVEFLRARP